MEKIDIGLIAAMPEEIAPFLRQLKDVRRYRSGRCNLYRFRTSSVSACLIESGMGPANATDAASRLIADSSPSAILNFGFAGAITPELKVGDIVIADRLLFFHEGLFSEQQWLTSGLPSFGPHLQRAAFITTSRITDKRSLAGRLPVGIKQALVEMETAAAAKVAAAAGIPFMAIRAISDPADEELGFTLDEFCDKGLNLKIWRVLLTVAKKPWIIPQLIRLAGNSKTAGNNLSSFLYNNINKMILP